MVSVDNGKRGYWINGYWGMPVFAHSPDTQMFQSSFSQKWAGRELCTMGFQVCSRVPSSTSSCTDQFPGHKILECTFFSKVSRTYCFGWKPASGLPAQELLLPSIKKNPQKNPAHFHKYAKNCIYCVNIHLTLSLGRSASGHVLIHNVYIQIMHFAWWTQVLKSSRAQGTNSLCRLKSSNPLNGLQMLNGKEIQYPIFLKKIFIMHTDILKQGMPNMNLQVMSVHFIVYLPLLPQLQCLHLAKDQFSREGKVAVKGLTSGWWNTIQKEMWKFSSSWWETIAGVHIYCIFNSHEVQARCDPKHASKPSVI